MMQRSAKRVIVSIIAGTHYGREAIRGILDYSSSQTQWEIQHQGGENLVALEHTLGALRRRPDGIIAQLCDARLARAIRRARIPAVDIWSQLDSRLPTIRPDDGQVGRIAARHFLSRGFRYFAWCDFRGGGQDFDIRRKQAYVAELRLAGHECRVRESSRDGNHLSELQRWLRSLPKPVALMAPHDYSAREIVLACSWSGLRVPDEVAVIGVDNDDLECSLCKPLLSSIDTAARDLGHKAAALLDRMMQGEPPPAAPIEHPPLGLVVRQSSDTFAVEDPDIAAALLFISRNASLPITVEDVLANVPVSRRTLERRFVELFGRSPREHILRTHVEQAKHLLVNTSLKLSTIAERSGFTPNQAFSRIFRQIEELHPSEYRRRAHGRQGGTGRLASKKATDSDTQKSA